MSDRAVALLHGLGAHTTEDVAELTVVKYKGYWRRW
jgi:hypothetical protein